ncbi:MAG: enoyl-CoA delta isomerase 1 [archaeon]|nr:enoyl-CoA delta isomerase 1 [archaeon]
MIIDFIMEGGNLLVINEYGGDAVQKTNLNDLTKFFGIYFENTAIRSNTDTGSSSLPMINDFSKHEISKNIRKIVLGGCCSLRIAKNAMGICFSGKETWLEIYDNLNNIWIKNEDNSLPLIAAATYGQGRVVAIGDIEICSSNARFGLNALDNKKLIQNIFLWFQQPVKYETTIDWIMGQFAVQRDETLNLNNIFNNLINTIKGLEERITKLEEKLKLN